MSKLRLTAMIPVYNHGRYLPVAVEAMVKQGWPPDELILIDDASTDGSQQVVDELAKKYPIIRVVKHTVNQGVNVSLQEGLAMATGDYFYGGGADDMVLPGFFESALSGLEKFPKTPICAGIPVHWWEDTDEQFETCLGMSHNARFLSPDEVWSLVQNQTLDMGGAWTMFRVADLRAIGGFPVSLKWLTDWFAVYAMALGGGLLWTGRPAAVMRFHSSAYSSTGPKRQLEQQAVLAELAQLIVDQTPIEVQAGFRGSGILGQLGWPMARTLMAKPRYWAQLSPSFWRVCLKLIGYRAARPIARAIVPRSLRRSLMQSPRVQTGFDLTPMRISKTI